MSATAPLPMAHRPAATQSSRNHLWQMQIPAKVGFKFLQRCASHPPLRQTNHLF